MMDERDLDSRADSIRRWGYLQARYDPLGRIPPLAHPAIPSAGEDLERLKQIYTGPLARESARCRSAPL